MTDEEFHAFFKPYARDLEGFYQAAYWRLSDELIKELVRRHLDLRPGMRVLDAGGGTARWAIWLAEEFGVQVTVADKSPEMLAKARRNLAGSAVGPAVELVQCDMVAAPELASDSYDAVLSTYGVLSFVNDPGAAMATVARVIRPAAPGILMSHSLSNALSSKICRDGAGLAELREIMSTSTVKWAPHVPRLRVFSSAELAELVAGAELSAERMFGVTAVTHPGAEDFGYPYHTISAVSRALEDDEYFRLALDAELLACEQDSWAERGVNLAVKVRKPATANG